jgi:hypothetical protein
MATIALDAASRLLLASDDASIVFGGALDGGELRMDCGVLHISPAQNLTRVAGDLQAGSIRADSIQAASIAGVQPTISQACVPGDAIRQVNGDGTVICESLQQTVTGECTAGGEAISQVNADGTVRCESLQPTILGMCPVSAAIRQVNGDGTVVCQAVQPTITDSCNSGTAIRAVNLDGTVVCEPTLHVPPPLVALSSISQLGVMKVSGTFQYDQQNVAHGVVDHTKVLSVSMYIIDNEGQHFPPGAHKLNGNSGNDGREYYFKARVLSNVFQVTIDAGTHQSTMGSGFSSNHDNIQRGSASCTTAPCGNFVITILYDAS